MLIPIYSTALLRAFATDETLVEALACTVSFFSEEPRARVEQPNSKSYNDIFTSGERQLLFDNPRGPRFRFPYTMSVARKRCPCSRRACCRRREFFL